MPPSEPPTLAREVLLVDDSPLNIEILRKTFEPETHWKIHEAANGLIAWEMLDQWLVPDLCIVDIHMKPGTGLELADRIRKDKRFTTLKIIFLSGDSLRETVVQAAAFHPVGYLVKPLDSAQILHKVRQTLAPPLA
jgi:CheY-like chemotaxis protein